MYNTVVDKIGRSVFKKKYMYILRKTYFLLLKKDFVFIFIILALPLEISSAKTCRRT